ncbi:hypothetical protein OF83DRAFT_1090971 [Amylostereum chailletii]|nr:hypothetical protein OF83DRAFT_1090971 [Amylostereum chailletii]
MGNDERSPSPARAISPPSLLRLSLDSDRDTSSPPPPSLNGAPNGTDHTGNPDLDPIQRLQQELQRTRDEKEALASQYRNLLAKLTAMRTTLGNKLKQDAEELDRREQLVQQLTAQNDDLEATVETLKTEVIASNEEADRAARELDALRNRALQETAHESSLRERELRDAQADLERCRIERDDWERATLKERVVADEARAALDAVRRELEMERDAHERDVADLDAEREQTANLQSVLEDFQSARDHELRQAVKEYESQLLHTTQSLAEFKHRALQAELQLEESSTNTSRTHELEKEVKEKNLLIGKLRHEAVIINEHLMEALRRLRRNSSDTNVDRRLVTNVLLSFLTTPRADAKRFEMLSLLASILSWNDSEREQAGLQRGSGPARTPASSNRSRPAELEKTDETESFSRLWVEYLMTEAASGDPTSPVNSPSRRPAQLGSPSPRRSSNLSLPSTPTHATHPLSFPPLSSGTTTPPSTSPPSHKGKEKAPVT